MMDASSLNKDAVQEEKRVWHLTLKRVVFIFGPIQT